MDYIALKALDAAHTADLSPEDAAVALAAMTRPERQLVPLWKIKKTLVESGEWPAIVAGQQSDTPAVAGLCVAIVAYVDDQRFEHIDMDLQSTEQMLAGAVSAGLVSQATADALDAMADVEILLIADAGFTTVSPAQILRVRSLA